MNDTVSISALSVGGEIFGIISNTESYNNRFLELKVSLGISYHSFCLV